MFNLVFQIGTLVHQRRRAELRRHKLVQQLLDAGRVDGGAPLRRARRLGVVAAWLAVRLLPVHLLVGLLLQAADVVAGVVF